MLCCPLLLMHGQHDALCYLPLMRYAIQVSFRSSTPAHVLPHCGEHHPLPLLLLMSYTFTVSTMPYAICC